MINNIKNFLNYKINEAQNVLLSGSDYRMSEECPFEITTIDHYKYYQGILRCYQNLLDVIKHFEEEEKK